MRDRNSNNNNNNDDKELPPFFPLQNQNQIQPQQRPKSSYLRSLMGHKRSNTVGAGLIQLPPAVFSTDFQKSSDRNRDSDPSSAASVIDPPELLRPPSKLNPDLVAQRHSCDMNLSGYQRRQFVDALGELQPNQLDGQSPRSPEKKSNPFATISLKSPFGLKDSSKASKNRDKGDQSPTKPKKVKSAANIGQLLRPKSTKNLRQQQQEEEENNRRRNKDKENRAPSAIDTSPPPPIYVQFARGSPFAPPPGLSSSTTPVASPLDYSRDPFWDGNKPLPADLERPGTGGGRSSIAESQHLKPEADNRDRDRNSRSKPRPKSFHQYFASNNQQDEKRTPSDSSTDTRYRQPQSDSSNPSTSQERQERSWKRQTWATAKGSELSAGGSQGSDRSNQRLNVKGMFSGSGSGNNGGGSSSSAAGERTSKSAAAAASASMERQQSAQSLLQHPIDPKDIDKHLEAMLDRRNIPENQRYKMRNLNDTIKLEFIRQDWAEMQAKMVNQNASNTSLEKGGNAGSVTGGAGSEREDQQQQQQSSSSNSKRDDGSGKDKENERMGRTKRKGFGLSLGKGAASKNQSSPTKSIGRHFRSKSNDSSMSERPSFGDVNGTSSGNGVGGFLGMKSGKSQQLPADFVAYLQKVQKPELVEVGRLHKLRLLLRNETVAWTEEFIKQGGMKEIVDLLHRIMAVEWREEHEDALLHENLLCLKALCTTALALQYLHTIHTTLFPALLHLIFDPEKKGPSEFTTRNIITSILLTYIECATPQERVTRAQTILQFLRDPETEEEKKPVNFILEMRRERPYRVWCKEAVSVTKEVFWIFLHNMNIVSLPPADSLPGGSGVGNGEQKMTQQQQQLHQAGIIDPSGLPRSDTGPNTQSGSGGDGAETPTAAQLAYMSRHFPQERPPVPAAPYVGGVEWDATNYLASHLDLMNAIIACTGPTATERNALRAQLRISGWERCLGGSLRMCKEKFYGSVHDGLRTWVAAAHEDGWDVRDVRFGPPPESRSVSPMKKTPGKKPREEAPPKIEIPKLDFHIGGANSPGITGVSPGGLVAGVVAKINDGGAGGGGGRSPMPASPAVRTPDYWLS